jgi:integrase
MEQYINFIKATLDSLPLPPKGKRSLYYDAKMPHLAIRVSDTGNKSFLVYRWVEGRALKRTLGRYPSMTIEQARRAAESCNAQLSCGVDPQDERRQKREELNLGELFALYLNDYAKHHCKRWKESEYFFKRYLSHLANRRISSITHIEVQRLHSRLGTDSGHTTANRAIEHLKAIINKGKKWKLVDCDNPCCGIEKYKLKPRQRFVESKELPALIKAIEDEPDEIIRDFIWILLSTGVRKTNVLEMRWDQLDLPNAVWKIPDTKNGDSQTILLTENELEILNRRHSAGRDFQWVFPSTGASGHLADPKKGWHRILKRAEIEDLHLHDLRRSLGSYMAMTGASLSVIGNALNHKDVSTTRKVYAQSAREAERAARLIAHARMFGNATGAKDTNTQRDNSESEAVG